MNETMNPGWEFLAPLVKKLKEIDRFGFEVIESLSSDENGREYTYIQLYPVHLPENQKGTVLFLDTIEGETLDYVWRRINGIADVETEISQGKENFYRGE